MVSTSPTSAIKPVFPWMLISVKPPAFVETTGTPEAMASRAANPKLSYSEVSRKRSPMASISSICSCLPTNCILSHIFNLRDNSSAVCLSGPSPTNNNLAGICFCTSLNICTTSSTLLIFLKLDA